MYPDLPRPREKEIWFLNLRQSRSHDLGRRLLLQISSFAFRYPIKRPQSQKGFLLMDIALKKWYTNPPQEDRENKLHHLFVIFFLSPLFVKISFMLFYLVFNVFNCPVFARSDKPHHFSLCFCLGWCRIISWLKIFGSKVHGDNPSRRSTAIFDCNHVSKFTSKLTQKLSKSLNALPHSLWASARVQLVDRFCK